MRRVLAIGVALWVAFVPVTAAQAGDGVTYDDDSPAGKEYALPLDSARNAGGGSANGASSSPADAAPQSQTPLFGAGVKRARSHGPRARATERQPSTRTDGRGKTPSRRDLTVAPIAQVIGPGDHAGPLSAGAIGAGIVAAVVLLAGLGLRRRRT